MLPCLADCAELTALVDKVDEERKAAQVAKHLSVKAKHLEQRVAHKRRTQASAQERVDKTYRDYRKWTEMAIIGVAKSGKFSSDRTIAEYCSQIWDAKPVPVPHPATNPNQRTRSFANLE